MKPYNCGIGPAFEVIGGKWKAVILWELHVQPRRFGELKRLLPGHQREDADPAAARAGDRRLVNREAFHEVPPRVEYSETKLGATLNAALGPLADWGDRYAKRVEAARKKSEG
jgi:DNA-binding HxlR family transcriptional regulator